MPEWNIELAGTPLDELQQCFRDGPLHEGGKREKIKHLVGHLKGLKIEIFSDEHPPPHFRVKFSGESNSFRIADGSPIYPDGDLKKYFRNIKKWHAKNKQFLVQTWNDTRPSGCPVGKIVDDSPDTKNPEGTSNESTN